MTRRTLRNSVLVATLIALPLLMGPGCPLAPAHDSPAEVQDVTPAEAEALIQSHQGDPGFIILDVRTPAEFDSGHIAGALNACVMFCNTSFEEAIADLDRSASYLVYCGSAHRSPTAAARMLEQGFTHVYQMTGGLSQWQNEGRPVEQ